MSRLILRNSIRTPDGTVITSRHVHDYVTHIDKNGEEYMVDGGLSYLRGNVNKEKATPLHLYSDDDHSVLRDGVTWGTYGKDGTSPLQWKKIKDMSTNHITAVLEIPRILPQLRKVMKDEIVYRNTERYHERN